ncbi:hypothetical protein ABE438_17620 [Bosea sp. TWI1241]|uniref:hypothetical protein n=1 Tax=Bosea sp. TWI1241 TaxID=3148904 RepID=UPI003208AC17
MTAAAVAPPRPDQIAAPAEPDRALDYEGARLELARLGVTQAGGEPYSERQVRRLAEDSKLPFFKAPDRRRLIMRSALIATVRAWQVEATRSAQQSRAEALRARRPKGRA